MVLALAMIFFHGGGAGPLHEDGRFEDCPKKDGDQFGHPLCRAFAVLVIVVVWFPDQVNAVALVIGVLGLKAGAYLQPVIHRIVSRWAKKEE